MTADVATDTKMKFLVGVVKGINQTEMLHLKNALESNFIKISLKDVYTFYHGNILKICIQDIEPRII